MFHDKSSGKLFLYFHLLTLFLFCFSASGIYADEKKKISLNECINVAIQNNSQIQGTKENWNKSMSSYRYAKAQRGLKTDAQFKTIERLKSDSSSDSQARIPGKDTDIGLFAGLYNYYYLYDAQKKQTEEAAKASLSLTRRENEKLTQEIIYSVKKAYYEYLLANDTLTLREQLLEKAKNKQKLVRTLYDNGMQPALDVTQADVSFNKAVLEYEKARNTERNLKSSLCTLMGVSDTDYGFCPVDKDVFPVLKYSSDELNRLAKSCSPELRLLSEKKNVARLNIETARAANKPSVFLTLGIGLENKALYLFHDEDGKFSDNFRSSNWEPVFSGTITASVPVYYSGAISAKVDGAVAEYNSLSYQEKNLLVTMKNSIESQYYSVTEQRKQIQMSLLIIENSEKHALLAKRSYENGAGSMLDYQTSEEGIINAQLGYLESVYQYYLTLASLSYTAGMSEDKICQK